MCATHKVRKAGYFFRGRISNFARQHSESKQILSDECGANMVEYALLAALVAIIVFAALQQFGLNLSTQFSQISSKVAAG
jgi:Flp pilus assembly pilin Flp